MTDLQYRNRSINSLVQQLNHLGNREVLICPTELVMINSADCNLIRRFQTKSKPPKQFLKIKDNQKKYYYNQIWSQLEINPLQNWINQTWKKGYNCTILMNNNQLTFINFIQNIHQLLNNCLVFGCALNTQNQVLDIFGQTKISHRELLQNKKYYDLTIEQILQYIASDDRRQNLIDLTFKDGNRCIQLHIICLPQQFFSTECPSPFSLFKTQLYQILNYIKVNPNKRYQHISHLITKRHPLTNYFTKVFLNDSCNLVVNCIQNKNNIQNYDIKLQGKFQFFDKLTLVSNLLRKPQRHVFQIAIHKILSNPPIQNNLNQIKPFSITESKIKTKSHQNPLTMARSRNNLNQNSNKQRKLKEQLSPICQINNPTQNDLNDQNFICYQQKQKQQQKKQLEFCRSLERKTHKYSISPNQQILNTQQFNKKIVSPQQLYKKIISSQQLDKKTISKYQEFIENPTFQNGFNPAIQVQNGFKSTIRVQKERFCIQNNESEKIGLLKAQHARQISQYHQTIQNLNKKIMILTKQLNLDQLYKVHQREIMLLQLKIQQLRADIIQISKDQVSQNTTKSIIRKLNEQLNNHETNPMKKVSQGRILMLQRQLKQTKLKLTTSDKARINLSMQVDALIKRLRIRDKEIQQINKNDTQMLKQTQVMSITQEELYQQFKKLVHAVKDGQRNSLDYLMRKIQYILNDLSKSRDIILECNDFLVQLMEILDQKLSNKSPEIVLDCNKFIRSFLTDNLSIF